MSFPPSPMQSQIQPAGSPLPVKNSGFGGLSSNRKRWDESLKWLPLKESAWTQLRFAGDIYMVATSWIKHQKSQKKFPMLSLAWDPESRSFSRPGDPIMEDFNPKTSNIKEIQDIMPRQQGFTHAFDRSTGEFGPVRIPISLALTLHQLASFNKVTIDGEEYECDIADPYYGIDVYVFNDPNGKGEARYKAQAGPRTPITEQEQARMNSESCRWMDVITYPSRDEIRQALTQNGYYDMINPNQSQEWANPAGHQAPPVPVPSNYSGSVPPPPFPSSGPVVQSMPQVPVAPPLAPAYQAPVAPPVVSAPMAPPVMAAPLAPASPAQAMGVTAPPLVNTAPLGLVPPPVPQGMSAPRPVAPAPRAPLPMAPRSLGEATQDEIPFAP